MDLKTGPLYFMENFVKIQHPTKGSMAFKPYDYQKRLIESYNDHRFSIAMLPRQTGKTTCASGYLIWYAMFKPDSQILIAAHKYAGASDIMSRVRYAYEIGVRLVGSEMCIRDRLVSALRQVSQLRLVQHQVFQLHQVCLLHQVSALRQA